MPKCWTFHASTSPAAQLKMQARSQKRISKLLSKAAALRRSGDRWARVFKERMASTNTSMQKLHGRRQQLLCELAMVDEEIAKLENSVLESRRKEWIARLAAHICERECLTMTSESK